MSYIRHDEPGTSLRAANWWPTATVPAEDWTRRATQKGNAWLPGLYQPAHEAVDRVRWEFGPDAAKEMPALAMMGRRRVA